MATLLPIIVSFLLTGVIGNRLLQTWQSRNWLLQQRYLGWEKEYLALKELADEISTLLGVRIFHMQRLNWALASGTDDRVKVCLQEYDETLKRWNERLTSFYIRLPILANYDLAQRLETSVQDRLVKCGRAIEELASRRKAGKAAQDELRGEVERDLNLIQGQAIAFNKSLLDFVQSRRGDVYYGKRLHFSPQDIEHYSTWMLVKALFVREIDSLSIVRPPLDF